MIRISLGGVGSGKTANEIRELVLSQKRFNTYTNITTKHMKNVFQLKPEYIIKKEEIGKNKFDYQLNKDFWKDKQPLRIILDEFHNIANARNFMSKKNKIFNIWLTMIRRILGSATDEGGELILITQLTNQVDIIARELCHQVRFHICHYKKICKRCHNSWAESSENPEPKFDCPVCGSFNIKKYDFKIEIWCFTGINSFKSWKDMGLKTYYRHYFVNDIENFFKYYDSFQWDNLFEEY